MAINDHVKIAATEIQAAGGENSLLSRDRNSFVVLFAAGGQRKMALSEND